MYDNLYEEAFVIIQPDGVERDLVGEIFSRFARAGLKFKNFKMAEPDGELIERFLGGSKYRIIRMGLDILSSFEKSGIDPEIIFGTTDPFKIGKKIKKWSAEFWLSGKAVPMIIFGDNAIERVKAIIGHSNPLDAKKGTIRGDYSRDTLALACSESRHISDLVYMPETQAEVKTAIDLWFKSNKIFD